MFRLERLAKDGSDLQRPSVFTYTFDRTIKEATMKYLWNEWGGRVLKRVAFFIHILEE